jgi:hypothetical protein
MTAAWIKKKASTVGCRTKTALWSGVSASSFSQLERVAQRSVRVSWSDKDSRHYGSSGSTSMGMEEDGGAWVVMLAEARFETTSIGVATASLII